MSVRIPVVESIMSANDRLALSNRERFDEAGVYTINLMASPGAGKTSLILRTIEALRDEFRLAVIDGDIATSIDTDKVAETGVPAVQINTGGSCHLDANMLQLALPELALTELDLLIVENVGNLVCPAEFKLGVHRDILIASVPEGADKPYKYPGMYRGVDAVVLNKIDVLPHFDFDVEYFRRGVEVLNPGLTFFPLSCKTGEGTSEWVDWLRNQVKVR